MARKPLRCAVYTRKSSEEGLEQDFNSLDAQREACAAYIKSQIAEGWVELAARYDDGGLSGATLERPALKRLLADVEAGRIDVVVVYKVDRLTRSLADFAKIVEIFDARGVSFVSITQQFNTTTSMGRLTLNVLLSFAQFEREVTAERIRDKVAASKKKGLWMGGTVSLGYDVCDKQLVVNPQEAETVRHIYRRYLELGSIPLLQQALAEEGVRSKARRTRSGRLMGGTTFGRGALYTLLSNPLYHGRIRHKDKTYPGQHAAIVNAELWEAVQKQLADNRVNPSSGPKGEISLLAGLIVDENGQRLTPSHAVKKGKRYRYYLSAALTRGRKNADGPVWRLPAKEIEDLVRDRLQRLLADPATLREALPDPGSLSAEVFQRLAGRARQLAKEWSRLSGSEERQCIRTLVTRIHLDTSRIGIAISPRGLIALSDPEGALCNGKVDGLETEPYRLILPARLRRRGLEKALVIANNSERQRTDDTLIRLLARAHAYQAKLLAGNGVSLTKLAEREDVTSSYVTRLLRLSYLSPDIVEQILEGRQPRTLTAAKLLRLSPTLPHAWKAQRERLLDESILGSP